MPAVRAAPVNAARQQSLMMADGIGEALKRRRLSLGMEHITIAGQINMEAPTIRAIEDRLARAAIGLADICALAVALDCRIEVVEINDRGK